MFSGVIEYIKGIWYGAAFGDAVGARQTVIPVDIGVIIYWIILFRGYIGSDHMAFVKQENIELT